MGFSLKIAADEDHSGEAEYKTKGIFKPSAKRFSLAAFFTIGFGQLEIFDGEMGEKKSPPQ